MTLATAYCAYTDSLTASGEHVHPGIIATRNWSIPFGTRVTITPSPYRSHVFYVEDRMAQTDRASVDIYMTTCSQADQWGIRRVTVHYTYPKGKR